MILLIYFPSRLTNTTYKALYNLKNETTKGIPRVVTFYFMAIISHYVNVTEIK